MAEGIHKKLVIVGDGAIGKTCLLMVFSKDQRPERYLPTIADNHLADIEILPTVFDAYATDIEIDNKQVSENPEKLIGLMQ